MLILARSLNAIIRENGVKRMFKNRKIFLVLVIILFVIFAIMMIRGNKIRKNKEIENDYIVSDVENIEEIMSNERKIRKDLLNVFNSVEADYKAGKAKYDGYERSAFYNEQRINEKLENESIEFANLNEIVSGELYDTKGRKIENYTDINLNGKRVEIVSLIETGKSYIVRVHDLYSPGTRNYYYLIEITEDGVKDLEWICFTEGETDSDNLMENEGGDIYEQDEVN